MRIFILTLGTRGDFELFRILGGALRRRGHAVVVGTSGFFAERVRAAGLGFLQIGTGTQEEAVRLLRSLAPVRDGDQRTRLYAARWVRPQLAAGESPLKRGATGADYFISNLKLAMRRGREVMPGAFVTYDPPAAVEDLSKYGSAKYAGRILELVALSKPLVDPDDRWGSDYHFTGFWCEAEAASPPPAALADFLADGQPPVVHTLGSMATLDVVELTKVFATALVQTGQRGVIVGGWSDLSGVAMPMGRLYGVGEAPYDWLFPRATCILHHGGCGTVAAVLRAGRPSVLLPQITAQVRFGRMLEREGLAAAVLDMESPTAEVLAGAIRRALTDARCRESAVRWRERVAEEGGVETAVDLIEAHWRRVCGGGSPRESCHVR